MARPQQRVKRLIGRATFADNSRLVFDLPRDYDLESIQIYFEGTATPTVAGTAVRAEAPLQVLKFISLKANGTDLLDGVPGWMAHRLGMFRRGQLPPLTPPSAATTGAKAIAGSVTLDRAVIDGIRAKDGNFPARGLSTFQLEIVIGAANDLLTGTPTSTMTGTVKVTAIQTIEMAGADGRVTLPRVVSKRTHMDLPFTTSNTNFKQRINTGNILRGLLLRSAGSVTAGEPSDAIINNVRVEMGNQVLIDMPWADIRAMNAQDYEITTVPVGYGAIDFMGMGAPANRLADALDLRAGQEANVILDVNGAANNVVGITTMEYMPFNPRYWGLAA